MNLQAQKKLDSAIGGPLLILLKPLVMAAGKILRRDHKLPDRSLEAGGRVTALKMLGGGSLVIALPALLGIRQRYPKARLQLVTTTTIAPFARTLGVFDQILEIDHGSFPKLALTGVRAVFKSFNSACFLDLEVYSKLSTIFSLFTCSRNRLGFYLENVVWRKPVQTHLIFFNRFAPIHLFYEKMASLLGARPASHHDCQQRVLRACGIPLQKPSRAPGAKRLIAIGAGCSDLGRERMFTAPEWLEAVKKRIERDASLKEARFLFLGGPADADLAREVAERLREIQITDCENLCGRLTLAQSLEKLRFCEEFWGIDSSLLHYARLLGARSVSYWGPTAPSSRLKAFPIEEEIHYRKAPCSPCVHVAEFPPCGGKNACMKSLISPMSDAELEENLPVMGA